MSIWEGSLYTVRRGPSGFVIVKFDDFFNPIETYHMRRGRRRVLSCDCPQSREHKCKHRTMLLIFEEKQRVHRGWFFDWDDHSWEPPLTWPISQSEIRIRLRDY